MSGKGSGRRPTQIPDEEAEANWARCFPKAEPVKAVEPEWTIADYRAHVIRKGLAENAPAHEYQSKE